MRVSPLALFVFSSILSALASAQEAPWKERVELSASEERFAKVEVIWTSKYAFDDPDCAPPTCELEVEPFDTACDDLGCQLLCPATTPGYAQPTPTHHCSGILVAENLILTAGHCIGGLPANEQHCLNQRIIFDYAVKTPDDELGQPVEEGDTVTIPSEDVFPCLGVQWNSPFPSGTSIEEAFSSIGDGGDDWALMQIPPVGPDRIPVPTERAIETLVGDQGLILGHPALIPAKIEAQSISTYTGATLYAPFHVLTGSSGSGIVNAGTGKVVGLTVYGPMELEASVHPLCSGLYELCFSCETSVIAEGMIPLGALIPKIGLQVTPVLEAHHYGPPTTTPDEFPGQSVSLSVPLSSDPVNWRYLEEGILSMLDLIAGASSGSLLPGTSTSLTLRPKASIVEETGLFSAPTGLFDDSYFTRSPIVHRIHVGVDGFTVQPTDPFDGELDLGVNHDDRRVYRAFNQWSVDQNVTVLATEDPDDPSAPWPSWLKLNLGTVPLHPILPPKGVTPVPQIRALIDGTNLDPGTYPATIVFSTDLCDEVEECKVERDVYFDHCREIHVDEGVPDILTLEPWGGQATHTFNLQETGGVDIDDVDIVMDLQQTGGSPCLGTQLCGWTVRLRSPDPGGEEVLLKNFGNAPQLVYDEETDRPAAEPLSEFMDDASEGDWTLTVQNHPNEDEQIQLTLDRFETRLHHEDAVQCVTEP